MNQDYAFWSSWKLLSTFEFRLRKYGRKTLGEYAWNKWLLGTEENAENIKKAKFATILINKKYETDDVKMKREKSQNKYKEDLERLKSSSLEKISNEFEWSIWNDIVWLEANIQWTQWEKVFWFYWLIEWLKKCQNWPNWNRKILSNLIKFNSDIKRQLETWISICEEKEVICNIHNKSWDIFWKTWEGGICGKWVLLKTHAEHDLDLIEDVYKNNWNKIDELCTSNSSASSIKHAEILRLNDNKEINDMIIKDATNIFSEKLNIFKKELANLIKRITNHWISKVIKNIKEWEDLEREFNKFDSWKDKYKFIEINEKIKQNEFYTEETKSTINEIDDYIKQNKCADFRKSIVYKFCLETNLIVNKNETFSSKFDINDISIEWSFVSIENSTWRIWVQQNNDQHEDWYLKIALDENQAFSFKNKANIILVKSNSKINEVNILVNISEFNAKAPKIYFIFYLWRIEKHIKEYIAHIKKSIADILKSIIETDEE